MFYFELSHEKEGEIQLKDQPQNTEEVQLKLDTD
jgi:hypothetical protein